MKVLVAIRLLAMRHNVSESVHIGYNIIQDQNIQSHQQALYGDQADVMLLHLPSAFFLPQSVQTRGWVLMAMV